MREYIGSGPAAQAIARADAERRARRQTERAAENLARARLTELDGPVAELNAVAHLLARATLLAAGYHRHHRPEWRHKRERGDVG